MRRSAFALALIILLAAGLRPSAAQTDPPVPIAPGTSSNETFIPLPLSRLEEDTDYAVQWMRLLYNRVEGERRNVPQAARIYAYAGVTLYLGLMPGMDSGTPGLAIERLNGLPPLPVLERGVEYDAITIAASALSSVIPAVMAPLDNRGSMTTMNNFNTAESNATRRAVAGLAERHYGQRLQEADRETVARSIAYGQQLAAVINEWAAADQFAETRGMTYAAPQGEGLWVTNTQGLSAMEPYWGLLRPFVLPEADSCAIALDVPFDNDLDSTFHQQAMEVRDISLNLTEEQREIARFWDERIGESGTASGHWLYVEDLLVDYLDLSLQEAATMYALVGVTMGDAFISAWSLKYQANLPRPETYINTYLDPSWEPLRQTPPFPAYPSGHAVLGGAVAEALTGLYGPTAYIDRYGVQYGLRARHYTSFEAAAYENAISRLYAGVHYRVDMENGLQQGRCIGAAAYEMLMGDE